MLDNAIDKRRDALKAGIIKKRADYMADLAKGLTRKEMANLEQLKGQFMIFPGQRDYKVEETARELFAEEYESLDTLSKSGWLPVLIGLSIEFIMIGLFFIVGCCIETGQKTFELSPLGLLCSCGIDRNFCNFLSIMLATIFAGAVTLGSLIILLCRKFFLHKALMLPIYLPRRLIDVADIRIYLLMCLVDGCMYLLRMIAVVWNLKSEKDHLKGWLYSPFFWIHTANAIFLLATGFQFVFVNKKETLEASEAWLDAHENLLAEPNQSPQVRQSAVPGVQVQLVVQT